MEWKVNPHGDTRSAAHPVHSFSTLQALVGQLVAAELGQAGAFYLFTTPPRQVCTPPRVRTSTVEHIMASQG